MSDIQDFKHSAEFAAAELGKIKAAWNGEYRELMQIEETRISALMAAKYAARRDSAQKIAGAALALYTEALESQAKTGLGCPLPIGSKVIEWTPISRYGGGPKAATNTGIVEAITRESIHPANAASYSRAKVGDFVIRLLKKDGSIGSKYCRMSIDWTTSKISLPYGWHPEGFNPNTKEAES